MNTPFPEDELRDLAPAEKLWELPDDAPLELALDMPTEEDVMVIYESYFGKNIPEGWTMGLARAMVNLGRQRKYKEWKDSL